MAGFAARMSSPKTSKKQSQGKTVSLLAKFAAVALLMQLIDFSSFTVNAWSFKGMLGMEEKAQPKNDPSSFLGNAPDSKRALTTAAAVAGNADSQSLDYYACSNSDLYKMVRWVPATSTEWFKSNDNLQGSSEYGVKNDMTQ